MQLIYFNAYRHDLNVSAMMFML